VFIFLPNVWQFGATLPIQIEKWFQSFGTKQLTSFQFMLIYTKKKTYKGRAKEVGQFFGFLQDGIFPVRFENVLPT
jgi:transposase